MTPQEEIQTFFKISWALRRAPSYYAPYRISFLAALIRLRTTARNMQVRIRCAALVHDFEDELRIAPAHDIRPKRNTP